MTQQTDLAKPNTTGATSGSARSTEELVRELARLEGKSEFDNEVRKVAHAMSQAARGLARALDSSQLPIDDEELLKRALAVSITRFADQVRYAEQIHEALAQVKRMAQEPATSKVPPVTWTEAALLGVGGLIDFFPESLPTCALVKSPRRRSGVVARRRRVRAAK